MNGKKYKIFQATSRRLTKGEENAVALAGLRMASETRRWIPGEPHEVSALSVMSKVFDNPKLMSTMTFISWYKRIGIKKTVRSRNQARGTWLQVPNSLEGREMSFGDPGQGTCWQILVKPEVLYEALKLHADNKWQQNTPQGDAVKGSHVVQGNPEDHLDQEVGGSAMGNPNRSICDSGPKSLYDAARGLSTMEQPLIFRPDEWMKPSDPRNIIESLDRIDRLLDEAEQMSQVGYRDGEDESEIPDIPWEEPKVEEPVRRIPVPPEARGWDDED